MDSALVCAICDCRLFPDAKGTSAQDPFALNPCGHVFHRECTEKWLNRSPTCPTCRGNVQNGRRLFFAEDTNPADDYPGGSDEEDERPKEDAPWYEKYAESIIFAGGAIMGALAAGVVAAAVSKKSDKKEEKK